MHFQTVTTFILTTLCAGSQVWEDNTMCRAIPGVPNLGICMKFDQNMPGTKCEEFRNGGTSKGGCTSGSLIPQSITLFAGRCVIFDQPGCKGRYADSNGPVSGSCSELYRYDWGSIRSFWCSGW
ncbi:hypothetical protein EDB82DRAFT_479276 [Fusarium venenatum]|uniref:uncharacterized protein n=1 Tax=Fusarium venenatum TaxID=56646 RepID=UPI001E002152|nr:hypothetical protein EDB82DRAFT_479276 [Fusarium venenatum]